MDVIYFRLHFSANTQQHNIFSNNIAEIVLSLYQFTDWKRRCWCSLFITLHCCLPPTSCNAFLYLFLSTFCFNILLPLSTIHFYRCCLSIKQTKSARVSEKETE